jgi:DNA ligase-1
MPKIHYGKSATGLINITCVKLYSYDSKGRVKKWQIGACQNEDGTADMVTEAGLAGGKLKRTKRLVKVGKNIGKANETTPWEQACSEIKAKHQKKLDAGYVTDILNWVKHNFPMKAATYEDPDGKKSMKHHIVFPCHGTPKLNGLCTIAEASPGLKLLSKTLVIDYLKVCKHLKEDLSLVLDESPLHGELYKHGWTLEEINRCAKKYRPGKTEQLELHVYDLVDERTNSGERDEILDMVFENMPPGFMIKRVPWVVINNEEELVHWHNTWVKQGYEGACVRNIHKPYEIGHRSLHLQKVKLGWQDAEFEIIGGKAEAQYTGELNEIAHECIVYRCCRKDRPEVEFDCRPKGSIEQREKMYKNLQNDIGKDLKVRFFSYMESGAPEFPIGLMIRDLE